ncbi:peptide deformylase [Buchnera aphidicola]|uniref:peptide deformylase n=1 Tax=Buchnera aphidicola TaxID=9 RepID=UPI0020938995|nr:peptide deformylase [Buchnera aphidicola]USS94058.1 peptide deformylase [Buchnera aphidicola (Sipha maydis)]WII23603.1 peptide deformylase [Buchnera aphidicola (Sipha maydis)]
MKKLKILKYPNKKLRKIAKPVKKFDKKLKTLVKKMFYIMYKKQGIGLAAIQVNIPLQIIVIDKIHNLKNPLILINPKIKKKFGKILKIEEGCLSIPKYRYITYVRKKYILVKAYDIYGKKFILHAQDILSLCIQHEIDHLKGKLFIDYLSLLKQNRIHKKLTKKIH